MELMYVFWAIITIVLSYIILEQIDHQTKSKKLGIPGPAFQWPIVGGLFEVIADPEGFWRRQDGYGKLSWNSLMGVFMVNTTNGGLIRKILNSDSPDKLKMKVHPNAEKILGANNIAFMQGPEHKALRTQLLPLFTRRALAFYVVIQNDLTRQHIQRWLEEDAKLGGVPTEFRPRARDLNNLSSYKVFLGPYLDAEQSDLFTREYQVMNNGFLTIPVDLPGTALNNAVKSRKRVVDILTSAVVKSKIRMAKQGEEPLCLLDFWVEKMLEDKKQAEETNDTTFVERDNKEVACTVLDFLFASQDASTSSIAWTITTMFENPDVFAKVRAEQLEIRPNDEPVTHENIQKMAYTRIVVKEILRYRTPATCIPQEAQADYELEVDGSSIVIPKGTLIVPSLWGASQEGFTDAHKFDPDRFSPERAEDIKFSQNYLVFGSGAHVCMGKEYAINQLITLLAVLSTTCTWVRKVTKDSDKLFFSPTITPYDCLVSFSPVKKEEH